VDIDQFDYELPPTAIAQSAIEPRHDARVLIASDLSEIVFRELPSLLNEGDLLVVNSTKVRAARLSGVRTPSGGAVEILLTKRLESHVWEALVRPARRLRAGSIITCGEVVSDPVEGVCVVTLTTEGETEDAIEREGTIPLPPYFHGSLDTPDRYQTLFASRVGSSAAPTAALHFTEHVVDTLTIKGIAICEVELEVGLDTFRPMGDGRIEDHVIHSERVIVDQQVVQSVNDTKRRGGRVIAVGTTVVRSLESASIGEERIGTYEGETDLFIAPGYSFTVVDAVITNFHAPRTTLIVMLAALLGSRWREVYNHALSEDFRFLSFGDAMFIEVHK